LSKEVSDRLIKHGCKGKTITIKILKRKQDAAEAFKNLGHGIVDSFSKSYTTSEYMDDANLIHKHAYSMLKSFDFSCADIRGLGIQITRLDNNEETISRKLYILD
jgi:DNA repair protein REV1